MSTTASQGQLAAGGEPVGAVGQKDVGAAVAEYRRVVVSLPKRREAFAGQPERFFRQQGRASRAQSIGPTEQLDRIVAGRIVAMPTRMLGSSRRSSRVSERSPRSRRASAQREFVAKACNVPPKIAASTRGCSMSAEANTSAGAALDRRAEEAGWPEARRDTDAGLAGKVSGDLGQRRAQTAGGDEADRGAGRHMLPVLAFGKNSCSPPIL